MRRFFPRLVQQLLLLPVVLLVGAVGPTLARAAQLTLTWTDTSVNEDGFKIERKAGTTGTFAQVATVGANVTSYIDPNLTGGATYCYQVRAYNTAGNSAYSNTACGTVSADTQPPTVSISAPVSGSTVSGSSVIVAALASDNVGVVGVQFLLDGANLGSESTIAPYSIIWDTTTATNSTHNLAAVARDAAGNKTTSASVGVTLRNSAPSTTAGLRAAYSFNEGSGSTVGDASGNNNTGTLNGASWTTQGHTSNALVFGNGYVSLGNPSSLQLTGSLTLEAWVYPTGWPRDDAAVLSKRGDSGDCGWQLDLTIDTGPRTIGFKLCDPTTGAKILLYGKTAVSLNTWHHVAGVYDATAKTMHVYLDGKVDDGSLSGTIVGSQRNSGQNALIGQRSSPLNFPFIGRIDDPRIYSIALTQTQIQSDLTTPVGTASTSTTATAASTLATATAASTSITATAAPVSQAVKIGVFRPSTGQWYLDVNGNGLLDDCQIGGCPASFGQQGNRPVVGDWTGTGTAQIGVFDPTARLWQLDGNGNDLWDGCTVDLCLNFSSLSGNLPVAGRWTSTATKDLIGVYRPDKRFWRLDLNGNGQLDTCTVDGCWSFGSLSGLPVVGDWTGSGTTKLGIFNASASPGQQWKLDLNSNGNWDGCTVDACRGPFGLSGDK